MFENKDFPQPLAESTFENWLEKGRAHKIGYKYLLIVFDAVAAEYLPIYAEERNVIASYQPFHKAVGRESLVAAYDLYSESRIA